MSIKRTGDWQIVMFVDGVDESVFIQGHQMRFSTVDLTKSHQEIKKSLLALVMTTQFEENLVKSKLFGMIRPPF